MIVVTGATGQLGRRVIRALLERGYPLAGIAAVRDPGRAADSPTAASTSARPTTTGPRRWRRLRRRHRLLLISGSEVGRRAGSTAVSWPPPAGRRRQLLAYTSILHADTSQMPLAEEHRATEELIRDVRPARRPAAQRLVPENYTARCRRRWSEA